jgi:phosphoglycolate phosphatase-like HAD superfamily hydrolase
MAIAESGIDPVDTLVVGDDVRDLEAAQGAGVRAALVLTGKGRQAAASLQSGTAVYDDLVMLARALVAMDSLDQGQEK